MTNQPLIANFLQLFRDLLYSPFIMQLLENLIGLKNFSVDSRFVQPGDIYCALPGAKTDGHLFVKESFEKEASHAVVLDSFDEAVPGTLIRVNNVLESLQMLAKNFLAKRRPKWVIGVTGSVGKTTTKDFIATLLEGSYSVCKSPGNYNSQIGLPLTLLNHWKGEEALVLEMAMTHAGNIAQLVSIAPPDIALLTHVSLVHAENFESLEAIGRAKSEIFTHPQTHLGIYSRQANNIFNISSCGSCQKECFSLDGNEKFQLIYENGWIFKAGTSLIPLGEIHLDGQHHYHNLLGALSVCYSAGVSGEMLARNVKALKLPGLRFEHVHKKGIHFINDSYNASLDSVLAGLKSLPRPIAGGKKIGVLGGMTELGKFSEKCHQEVAIEALLCLDHLICYGEECRPMLAVFEKAGREAALFNDKSFLLDHLQSLATFGDVVYIKGSKSKMMWQIVDNYI